MSDDERKALPHASAWGRYEACHGSFQLEAEARRLGQVARISSPSARSGTRIHAYLGGVVDEDGHEIALDPEEQAAADTLQDLVQQQIARVFGDSLYSDLREKRMWLCDKGVPALSGRFDRCVYTDDVALVLDYKTSHVAPDPAETSSQLKVLAVLVALNLPKLKEIIVQIVSPYYGVTEARYDMQGLARAYRSILETLRAIEDERARLIPGVVQCRFCPALLICQAVKDILPRLVKTQVSELPADGERAARLLDEVELVLVHLEEIRAWYKGRMAQNPELKIPGYALVPGASVREISDWEKAREILRRYIPDRELEGVPTLTQLQQALKRNLKLQTPKAAADRLNQLLDGLIELRQNAPSFKRTSK